MLRGPYSLEIYSDPLRDRIFPSFYSIRCYQVQSAQLVICSVQPPGVVRWSGFGQGQGGERWNCRGGGCGRGHDVFVRKLGMRER